jgi:hypothetical protein
MHDWARELGGRGPVRGGERGGRGKWGGVERCLAGCRRAAPRLDLAHP